MDPARGPRKTESRRTGRSRIQEKDPVDGFMEDMMGVTKYNDIRTDTPQSPAEFRAWQVRGDDMFDQEATSIRLENLGLAPSGMQVVVSPDDRHRGDSLEFGDEVRAANVAGVEDVIHPCEECLQAAIQVIVCVGQETEFHRGEVTEDTKVHREYPAGHEDLGVDGCGARRVSCAAMSSAAAFLRVRLRPWWVLGRVSNLPTVWSNCLAAWLLSGGGPAHRFWAVLFGGTLVYVGGMFLNDACDAGFDRRYRRERPIPSGTVPEAWVWLAAGLALVSGFACYAALGGAPFHLGFLLVLAVIVYNASHKLIPFSPLVMALCRYLLFMAAGSAAVGGAAGLTAWSALALAAYVVGLSYVAKVESAAGALAWWPLLALILPLVLAAFANPPGLWRHSVVLAPVALFVVWTLRSLSHLLRGRPEGARNCVSGLLAGIVLVDLVAVMPGPFPWGVIFLLHFVAALVLQRFVPAT